MPIVELSVRKGAFTAEQKVKMGRDITEYMIKAYKELRGLEPRHVDVLIRELDEWLLNGLTGAEREEEEKRLKREEND